MKHKNPKSIIALNRLTKTAYPNDATRELLRRLSKGNKGTTFTNVAKWAITLQCSYSEARTAFKYAVDNGYLEIASGERGIQKVFVRTARAIAVGR